MMDSLILFDCDGTLVDSEYLNLKAIIETLNEYGAQGLDTHNTFDRFSGMRFSQIIAMIGKEQDLVFPQDASKNFLQKVRDLAPLHMHQIEGARDVVQLAKNRARIGVVSNGERNNVLLSLDFVNLRSYFTDEDIFTGLMAPPKPAPDLYLLAAQKMGHTPQHTLIIEDSVTGVKAGVAAGMSVWGFTGTHHEPENHAKILKSHGAQHVFATMAEIKSALDLL